MNIFFQYFDSDNFKIGYIEFTRCRIVFQVTPQKHVGSLKGLRKVYRDTFQSDSGSLVTAAV